MVRQDEEFYSGMQTAFPDIEVDIQELTAEDDKVVQRSRQSGTHDGEFMRIEATGNTFDVPGIVIYRIKDGKIADMWSAPDSYEFMDQLGVTFPQILFTLPKTLARNYFPEMFGVQCRTASSGTTDC